MMRVYKCRQPKKMQRKSLGHDVVQLSPYSYLVTSGTSGNEYSVTVRADMGRAWCSCRWGQTRRHVDYHEAGCSHVAAVLRYIVAHEIARIAIWKSPEEAARQHRSFWAIGDGLWATFRARGSG
jgi:hypothetical protein